MTGLDSTNQQNDIPNVQALGNSMSTALQKFAQCNYLRNDNSFISEKIREIKEQSENFRKYANESITQSEKLSKYAEEVVVFAVACADPSFTKEELLEFLKLTLEDAKNNKVDAEKLKANISGIMAELTNIQNECAQYSGDIQNNARMIRSKVVDELESKERKQRFFNVTYKVGVGAAILGTAASILAAPLTGGASLAAIPVIDEGALILAGTSGAIAFGSKVVSNRENSDIAALSKQLVIERDELSSRIGLLNNDLSSIVNESCDILSFWDEQITSLKELVEKLERYNNQDGERPSRLVTLTIQKKWNNVSRECKEYNRIVRAALQTSNMAISN